jgi:hypothetical protein
MQTAPAIHIIAIIIKTFSAVNNDGLRTTRSGVSSNEDRYPVAAIMA